MANVLFHIAFPVHDLEEARRFYVDGLGCTLGRVSKTALTLELKGHQIVAHRSKRPLEKQKGIYPRHFGLIFMLQKDWQTLADQAQAKGLNFYQQPHHRFLGTRLEHLTFMLEDPSNNLLEFKYYRNESAIFGEQHIPQVGDLEDEQ
jgi:extradiol dioxygenase family protein